MKSNRRDFLQKAGLMVSVAGIGLSVPSVVSASAINEEYSEITVVASANDAVTDTLSGKVRGYIRNNVFTFKGIPYGADTSGENRFMPPQKPTPWNDVKNCLVYGPISPQRPDSGWLQV